MALSAGQALSVNSLSMNQLIRLACGHLIELERNLGKPGDPGENVTEFSKFPGA